ADLSLDPRARAKLLQGISIALTRQLRFGQAVAYMQEALAIRERYPGDRPELQSALGEFASALRDVRRFSESGAFFNRALTMARGRGDTDSAAYVRLLGQYSRWALWTNDLPLAEVVLNEGVDVSKQLGSSNRRELAGLLGDLANIYSWHDDTARAVATQQE